MQIVDFSGINYFATENSDTLVCTINPEDFRQNYKKLTEETKLKVLFQYMKDKSEGNLYKKESNQVIAEYFGVGREMIRTLIVKLESAKRIMKLNDLDKFYKLKEEF